MPYFSTQPSPGIADSVRNLVSTLGGGNVSGKDLIAADHAALQAGTAMASAQHNNALSEKVRLEVEQMRKAAADRENPALATEYAGRAAGIDLPAAAQYEKAVSGVRERPLIENDDEGNRMPDVTFAKPAGVTDQQGALYNAARAALLGNRLATGKTNADELAKAGGHIQGQGITAAVQAALANGKTMDASAMNQGAVPGHEIKLFDNVGSTGATFAPSTGAVQADPNANPSNQLLVTTLKEAAAKAAERDAAAGAHKATAANAYASAGLHKAQTDDLKGRGGLGKPPAGYAWGASNAAGQPTLVAIEGGPAAGSAVAVAAGGLTGEDFLKTLPPGIAENVKGVAEGRIGLTNFSTKGGHRERMLELVGQYEPGFDTTAWKRRNETATAFAKGKQGDAVRSVNQTISHAGSLAEAIDSLNNMGGMGTMLNPLVNAAQERSGDSRQGVFRQRAQAVSSELRKVFSGTGGGSLTELEKWESSLPPNASKDQQKAYLKSGLELLNGAVNALDDQYKRGMGPNASVMDLISPKAKATLAKLRGEKGSAAGETKVLNGVTYVKIDGEWHQQ